jgi:PBP1b-binding outer membrane lipoprotein LpoB
MSTTTKTGITLIIILAVIVIGWFIMTDFKTPENKQVVEQKQEQTTNPTPKPKLPNTADTGMSDVVDVTQQGLETDINAVNNQMTELNTETTNIDNGLKETI